MLARLYRYSRLGSIFGGVSLFVSLGWIAVAFNNPWHQGPLMIMSFPASYLAVGFTSALEHFMPAKHVLILNLASDGAFVVVGTLWFFLLGLIVGRICGRLRNSIRSEKSA
jgi:hypothetical protein